MVVLEGRLQPVTVLRCLTAALSRRGHDDVRVVVAVVAMSPVRMLDHLDEAAPAGRRITRMTVEVLLVLAARPSCGPSPRGRRLPEAPPGQPPPPHAGR